MMDLPKYQRLVAEIVDKIMTTTMPARDGIGQSVADEDCVRSVVRTTLTLLEQKDKECGQ